MGKTKSIDNPEDNEDNPEEDVFWIVYAKRYLGL
jgi:hypothetical protein